MTIALTTGDPRFDATKPLTVNGYTFVPQRDRTEIATIIANELLKQDGTKRLPFR